MWDAYPCHESHHVLHGSALEPRERSELPCGGERHSASTGRAGENEQAVDLHDVCPTVGSRMSETPTRLHPAVAARGGGCQPCLADSRTPGASTVSRGVVCMRRAPLNFTQMPAAVQMPAHAGLRWPPTKIAQCLSRLGREAQGGPQPLPNAAIRHAAHRWTSANRSQATMAVKVYIGSNSIMSSRPHRLQPPGGGRRRPNPRVFGRWRAVHACAATFRPRRQL